MERVESPARVSHRIGLTKYPPGGIVISVIENNTMNVTEARHESKTKLLNAALQVIREKGYSATRIEDVCEAAGLTKGSFFHHFKSKEDLAGEGAGLWGVGA